METSVERPQTIEAIGPIEKNCMRSYGNHSEEIKAIGIILTRLFVESLTLST